MDYGVLTLVPILIVILIALTTRRTLEALMVGTLSTYIITDGFGFLHAWIEAFFSVATSRDNQWIFMVCALFGSLITLIGASRGTAGFSRHLEKSAAARARRCFPPGFWAFSSLWMIT